MRASILVLGLVLMAVYVVYCDAYAINEDAELIRVKRDPGSEGNGTNGGGGSGTGGSGNEKTEDANNTAIYLDRSLYKTMSFVVLPIVAAKIMI